MIAENELPEQIFGYLKFRFNLKFKALKLSVLNFLHNQEL